MSYYIEIAGECFKRDETEAVKLKKQMYVEGKIKMWLDEIESDIKKASIS